MGVSVKLGSGNRRATTRIRRHARVRRRVVGTAAVPRLAVFRSARHVQVQVIDDAAGRTLAAASSMETAVRAIGDKTAQAKLVGGLVAERAKSAGVSKVVFDRGGYRYHGRVAAVAAAARDSGLEF